MVIIKVSDGIETRKLRVKEGVTFSQLQEKLSTLFPHSVQGDQPLTLQYRDSDGDLITLSSDEEFQGVLSSLAADAVLRLAIRRSGRARTAARPTETNRPGGESILDHIFERGSTSLWDNLDKQLRQTESLFQKLWGSAGEEERAEQSNSEGGTENHATPTEEDGDRVKSKLEEEGVKSKPDSDKAQTPVIHCKSVLSLEPRVQYGWFGPRTVLKPVQYNIVYLDQPNQPKKQSGEETKEKSGVSGEQAPATKEESGEQAPVTKEVEQTPQEVVAH